MSGTTTRSAFARPVRIRSGAAVLALAVGLTGALPATALAAQRYRVRSGDTLAEIATAHGFAGLDGWRVLYDANPKLDNPDLIVPGQKLQIPDRDAKLKRRAIPETTPRRTPQASRSAASSTAPSGSVWTQLAACESGGNWAANTGNGYYGGLQFSLSSWRAVGGSGYPHQASAGTQIAMGQRLQASQGWGAWPGCAAQLGLN